MSRDTIPTSLAEQFQALRHERSLTLEKLAAETGMSIGFLSDLEHGRARPSLWTLEKLALYYDISMTEWLLEPVTPKTPAQHDLYARIGLHVKEAREAQGMTQPELARKIRLARTSITNIEAGRQRMLIHTLAEIAEVLGVRVEHLLRESEEV